MARGYGRRLDWTTLLVVIRHEFKRRDESAFTIRFTDRGWCSWWGTGEPEPEEVKWFETDDSAALALIVGSTEVLGVDDE